jgi:hypothetical protein
MNRGLLAIGGAALLGFLAFWGFVYAHWQG